LDDADDLEELQRLLAEGSALPPDALPDWLDRLPPALQRYKLQLRAMLLPTAPPVQAAYHSAPTTRAASQLGELALLAAGMTIGPYRLIRELGQGGMGAVWTAQRADGSLNRMVALKLPIYSMYSRGFAERFARERDILAALSHPNIASLYDAGVTAAGQPYLAMELVDGRPIDEYCDAQRLTVQARVALFEQALEAVQFAHRNLVIHRDLKPSNMLVTADGRVKLLDFGIAKLIADDGTARETQLTALDGRALTPDYASPEQVVGAPLTTASDVYSLGVVLYELLCGARPYRLKMDSRGALDDAILTAEPPRPSVQARNGAAAEARGTTPERLAAQLRGDLDTILLKALKKLPAERYDTVNAFAEDLRRWQRGEPVLARPDSRWYVARKFVARHRVVVAAAASVVVTLVAGLSLALWQAKVARQEQARAESVKSFLVSIFSRANPATGLGGDAKVSQLLQVTTQRVPVEFGNDPALAAEMYNLIAEGLWNLGEGAGAEQVAQRALEVANKYLPRGDLQQLRALHVIADVQVNTGRLESAEPVLAQLVAGLRASDAPEAPTHLVNALTVQSLMLANKGDRQQSVAVAREAVRLARMRPPQDKPVLLTALAALSDRLLVSGSYDEAVIVAREGADVAQQLYGSQRPHMMLSDIEQTLGNALLRNGRPADALPQLQRVVADTRDALGLENRQMSLALSSVGDALATKGDLKESVLFYQGALAIESELSPQLTPRAVSMKQRIANVWLNARQPTSAVAAYDEVIKDWQSIASPLAVTLARQARVTRALARAQLGQQAAALEELDHIRQEVPSKKSIDMLLVLSSSSTTKRWMGDATAALQDAREAGALLEQVPHAPRDRVGVLLNLGLAQLDMGDYVNAQQELESAEQLSARLQIGPTPALADMWLGLGRARLAAGDVDAALGYTKKAVDFWHSFDAESRWSGEAMYWHAKALSKAGHRAEAASQMARAQKILKQSPWANDRAGRL
jgi:serine/threonine-protein kinase